MVELFPVFNEIRMFYNFLQSFQLMYRFRNTAIWERFLQAINSTFNYF